MYAVRMDPKRIPGYGFEIENAPVQFAFCLSGKMQTVYNKGSGSRDAVFLNRAGTNSVCRMSGVTGRSRSLSDEACSCVALQIDRELLDGYLEAGINNIPSGCRNVLDGEASICALAMTGEMYQAASQVFTTLYSGSARQLYLESKALELLALQVNLLTREPASAGDRPLSRQETDCIRSAGEILVNEMQHPPTITGLSRMVGINEFKLKKGFKQVFGTTVFQFLQYHRMTSAREMIVNKGANVNQAADFVGYVNVGHFIACYKKAFGATPGDHKRIQKTG